MSHKQLLDARQAAYDADDKKELGRINAEIFRHGKQKKTRSIDEIFSAAKKRVRK